MTGWTALSIIIASILFTQFTKKYKNQEIQQAQKEKTKRILSIIGYLLLSLFIGYLSVGIIREIL
ncbi:MAG: hypothetical protein GYA51_09030 [Candidatus Methanofastidiosa archaeon]|nr:hypothetical protein [Candidatus Methanofastidiosa archaeon]